MWVCETLAWSATHRCSIGPGLHAALLHVSLDSEEAVCQCNATVQIKVGPKLKEIMERGIHGPPVLAPGLPAPSRDPPPSTSR